MMRLATLLMLAVLATLNGGWAAAGERDAYAAQLGRLLNDHRAQHGLQPLAPVVSFAELAREHAMHMAREHRLSHDGFAIANSKAKLAYSSGWLLHGRLEQRVS